MSDEMVITFPKKARVDARARGFEIATDQAPESGGDGSAPEPFTLFLASLGTCAGIYVLRFCQARGIPTDDIELVQRVSPGEGGKGIGKVTLDIKVPPSFPAKYHKSLVHAANHCAVKKAIENPPTFEINTAVKS